MESEVAGTSSVKVEVEAKRRKRYIFWRTAASKIVLICFAAIVVSAALTPWRLHRVLELKEDAVGRDLNLITADPLIRAEQTTPRPQQRRSLSIFKKNRCTSTPEIKQQPHFPIPSAYLATYPGSGARVARRLVKALTGLRVQNSQGQARREDVVAIQTLYPHEAGNLVEWDTKVGRAIILMRNPMHALPNFFDELYVTKRHLPANFHPKEPVAIEGAAAANVAEWISWRDRLFDNQMRSYREFLRYWTKRFEDQRTLIVAYEDLTDDGKGGEEATRLAEFLRQAKRVSTVELDDAPCVWQQVFKNGGDGIGDGDGDEENNPTDENIQGTRQMSKNGVNAPKRRQLAVKISDPDDGQERRQLASYYIPHPNSIKAAPSARPFSTQQLEAMLVTLHEISAELFSYSHHLHGILVRYRDEIAEVLKTQRGDDAKNEGVDMQSRMPPMRPFHIFQVSPPGTDSPLVINWLMGLFEPDAKVTKLVTSPGLGVSQDGQEVPITTTIVTQTNEMNLIGLYKILKPTFDEIFFVLSKSGTDADQQINEEVCEYDNVLCIELKEQMYNGEAELQAMVHQLTEKFYYRFGSFFGSFGNLIGSEQSATSRLKKMISTINSMENQPYEAVDPTFGVHGGLQNNNNNQMGDQYEDAIDSNATNGSVTPRRRLFYCGSSGGANNRHASTMGIFLANAFFPELVGSLPLNKDTDTDEAIELTLNSITDATPNDFLVFHMHQFCEVDVLMFPGLQLHINHPTYQFDAYGKYRPPGDNIFVIGPHEDGPHSVHLPFAMMKWWVLVKGLGSRGDIDQPTLEKFFLPSERPKNTGKYFLLYVNSHYAEHREMAAFALSQLGQMHALGSCQGNVDTVPIVDISRPARCLPYTDDKRPSSIIVPNDMSRKSNYFTDRVAFQDFRFTLLMEDSDIPGYITERIVDGFMAGTIPIYYGTTEVFGIFNPNAFIYYDISNPQKALERIRHLEENPDAYQQMLSEPILASGEHTIEKYFSFDDSIGKGLLKKRVRRKLGFPV